MLTASERPSAAITAHVDEKWHGLMLVCYEMFALESTECE